MINQSKHGNVFFVISIITPVGFTWSSSWNFKVACKIREMPLWFRYSILRVCVTVSPRSIENRDHFIYVTPRGQLRAEITVFISLTSSCRLNVLLNSYSLPLELWTPTCLAWQTHRFSIRLCFKPILLSDRVNDQYSDAVVKIDSFKTNTLVLNIFSFIECYCVISNVSMFV